MNNKRARVVDSGKKKTPQIKKQLLMGQFVCELWNFWSFEVEIMTKNGRIVVARL